MMDLKHVLTTLQGQGIPVAEVHLGYPEGEAWPDPVWEGTVQGRRVRLVLTAPLTAAQAQAVQGWMASPTASPREEAGAAIQAARDNWDTLTQAQKMQALRQVLVLLGEG
jgi:hypothetical protein